MRSTSVLRRIVVALSLLTVSHALLLDDRAAVQDAQDVNRRATLSLGLGIGGTGDAGSTTTTDNSSPASTPPSQTTDSTSATDKSTTTSTTAKTTSSTTSSSTSKTSSSTSSSPSSSAPSTTPIITVIVTTNADGSTTSITSESMSTISAGLAQGDGGAASGMSPQTRNTVIGVVVGIGGAIVLLAIGLLAWRIWGRKRTPDDNDELVNYGGGGYSVPEKSEASGSASGRTPFQSTLESYHAPTQVNTASNF